MTFGVLWFTLSQVKNKTTLTCDDFFFAILLISLLYESSWVSFYNGMIACY